MTHEKQTRAATHTATHTVTHASPETQLCLIFRVTHEKYFFIFYFLCVLLLMSHETHAKSPHETHAKSRACKKAMDDSSHCTLSHSNMKILILKSARE
jgi:hypothetical protein